MQALTRILAATDFSPAADRAVRRATLIAKQHGAELRLLHVVHPLTLYAGQEIDAGPLDEAALAAAGERLGPLAERLAREAGIRTHAAWRIGRAHSRIAEYAEEIGADLVVVGARGENTLLRLLLGSTANRLLRVRGSPTLIVRNEDVQPYAHVVAAVDFSRGSGTVLAWARRLAGEEQIDVVHVLEPELDRRLPAHERKQADAGMREIAGGLMHHLLADLPGKHSGHVETGYPPSRLLEAAQARQAELIVLGRHGQSGLEEYLLGSVSKDVAQAAACDVLLTGEN
ncbi:MAG: UspA domain-containing protein [bacterium]|jgi:nucleotide-binding universal stress UspA family protein|nr:MAG: UspA domain-containing protein [bacterium]KAF0149903.1 MAG: UspA domain-containing protein [bacterium]KAF0166365.1 MAG: UspA domain-containing protein [bacterium]TXT17014.1 MAG: UspA domain-containing protein [bacterium]